MIAFKNASIGYSGDIGRPPVISSFDLTIDDGRYVTILGPNGSGKSTLIKALCGLTGLITGEIVIDGKPVMPGRFNEDFFGKMAVVFQEPSGQFLMRDVESELAALLQNLGVSCENQRSRLENTVELFSLRDILYRRPEDLSGGQMQQVNLACAGSLYPEILVLDEPTTFLDSHYRELLLEMVDRMWKDGKTVIHVTQYPDEALRSQKVAILSDGKLQAFGNPDEILADESIVERAGLRVPRRLESKRWLGFDFALPDAVKSFRGDIEQPAARSDVSERLPSSEDKYLLNINNLYFEYAESNFRLAVQKFDLISGRITALVGPAGSGKSTLGFLAAGLLKPEKGDIILDGFPVSRFEKVELRRRIGITWQLPDSILLGPTVADDLESIGVNLGLTDFDIGQALARTRLSGFENRIVDSLSGGEKRKVSLAGALITDPDLLILDEPSAFLDPRSQAELEEIIDDLAKSGKAILLIGHDLPFIAEISDSVAGMKEGRIRFHIPAVEFFDNPSYLESLGLPSDPLMELRYNLVGKGISLPEPSINPKYIASRLPVAK